MDDACAGRRAFTLIELLVVIAVMTILASLLMPVVMDSLRRAGRIECLNNLKQLGYGNVNYSLDNDNFLPCYGDAYASVYNENYLAPAELIRPYVDHPKEMDENGKPAYAKRYRLFLCPSDANPDNFYGWHLAHPTIGASSYMWNEHVMTITSTVTLPVIKTPSVVGLIADGWECPNGWTWVTCAPSGYYKWTRCDWEHDGGVNVLYADFHADKVRHRELDKVRSVLR